MGDPPRPDRAARGGGHGGRRAGAKAFSGVLGPVFLALMLAIAAQPIQTRTGAAAARLAGHARRWSWCIWCCSDWSAALAVSAAQLGDRRCRILRSVLLSCSTRCAALLEHRRGPGSDRQALSGFDSANWPRCSRRLLRGLAGVFSNLLLRTGPAAVHGLRRDDIGRRMSVVAGCVPRSRRRCASSPPAPGDTCSSRRSSGSSWRCIDGAALWALGVPLPLLWGLLSFITNYIPNIGFVIGLIPPALLALLEGGSGEDDRGHRAVLRGQLRDPVGDPAEVRR